MKFNAILSIFIFIHLPLLGMLAKRTKDPKECPICMEPLFAQKHKNEQDVVTLACSKQHSYHFGCINKWRQQNPTCPACRNPLQSKAGLRVFDHTLQQKDNSHTEEPTFACFAFLVKLGCIGLGDEED